MNQNSLTIVHVFGTQKMHFYNGKKINIYILFSEKEKVKKQKEEFRKEVIK